MMNHDDKSMQKMQTEADGVKEVVLLPDRFDNLIFQDVVNRLEKDDQVNDSRIEVAVQSRQVTLMGLIDEHRGQQRAEVIAEAVPGVRHVENRLKVQSL